MVFSYQFFKLSFRDNGDAARVKPSRQHGRVTAIGNIGNLGSSKGHHAEFWVLAETNIEVVEVPPRCPHDNGVEPFH